MPELAAPSPFVVNMALGMLGLTDQQKGVVSAQIPTIAHMVSAINNANPLIQEANALYVRAQPLIQVLLEDWSKAGPAIQIIANALANRKLAAGSMAERDSEIGRELLGVLSSIEGLVRQAK